MKKARMVLVMFVVTIGFSAFAAGDNAEDEESGVICKLLPFTCGATTNGGNGDGEQPPKPD